MKATELLKVSVLIPIYKPEDYITAAIDSVSTQTFTDFELLIIDDSRTDRSARMDADDPGLPDRFALQLAFMETHPEVGALGGLRKASFQNVK